MSRYGSGAGIAHQGLITQVGTSIQNLGSRILHFRSDIFDLSGIKVAAHMRRSTYLDLQTRLLFWGNAMFGISAFTDAVVIVGNSILDFSVLTDAVVV